MLTNLIILAEGAANQNGTPPSMSQVLMQMLPLILMMVVIYIFVVARPQSRERKQREAMLAAIKKNDRVVTIGGIIGTVQSVRDDEITLKVDESSNTKITFTRNAVQRVTPRESGEKDA